MGIYNLLFMVALLPFIGIAVSFLVEVPRRAAQICTFFAYSTAAVALLLVGWRLRHGSDAVAELVFRFWSFPPGSGLSPSLNAVDLTAFQPQWGVRADPLSLSIAAAVAVLGALIHGNALSSMRGDPEYRRALWVSSALEGSVLIAVVAPNLFQLLLGSALASAFTWMLASHWWQQTESAASAWRGFVAARIGDGCLLFAAVVIFVKFGADAMGHAKPAGQDINDPFSFAAIADVANRIVTGSVLGAGNHTLELVAVLVVVAAAVRLWTVPFHAGLIGIASAPLAALAAAACLVPFVGVILLARLSPLLQVAPHVLSVLAVLGGVSSVLMAVFTLLQRDIARLTLGITAAQFGLVVSAFGVGGYSSPVAISIAVSVSSLLMLFSAAALVRSFRSSDIYAMGGAWKHLRGTAAMLGFAAALIVGLDLAGYSALATAWRNHFANGGHAATWVATLTVVLLGTAVLLIAAAAVRLWVRTCVAAHRPRRGFSLAKAASVDRTWQVTSVIALVFAVALAALSIPAANITFSHFVFSGAIRQDLSVIGEAAALALLLPVLGGGVGWWLGVRSPREQAESSRAKAATNTAAWAPGGYLDALLVAATAFVARRIGGVVAETDNEILDPLGGGVADGFGHVESAITRSSFRRLVFQLSLAIAVAAAIVLAAAWYAAGHLPRLAS